jgi:hypothetical protein
MEKKRRILEGAPQYVKENVPEGVANPATWVQTTVPEE